MNTAYGQGGYPFRPTHDPTTTGRQGVEITEQQIREHEKSLKINWTQLEGIIGPLLLADEGDYVLLYTPEPNTVLLDSQETLYVGARRYLIDTVDVTI